MARCSRSPLSCKSQAARDHGDDSARQIPQATAERGEPRQRRWPAGRAASDDSAGRAVPRHAGGRARRRRQHARRLSQRPRRSRRASARRRPHASPTPTPTTCAAFSASLAERGFKASSVARRLSAMRQLYRFLYAEGQRSDDPAAVLEGPKRGAPAAEGALHRRGRSAAGAGAQRHAKTASSRRRSGCARRGCCACSNCSTPPACASPNWWRCRPPAARRDQRMLVVRGKGGKERLVPLNEAAKRAMAEYLELRAEAGRAMRNRNGCSRRSASSGHLTRQHFARELKALGAAVRHRAGAPEPARAAPCLRQPSPA